MMPNDVPIDDLHLPSDPASEVELTRQGLGSSRSGQATRGDTAHEYRGSPSGAIETPERDEGPRREAETERTPREGVDLHAWILELRDELQQRDERILAILSSVYQGMTTLLERSATLAIPSQGATEQGGVAGWTARSQDYPQLIARVKEAVRAAVPAGAIVAVVSKGDEELLRLEGRKGWHFPQRDDGVYAGHYPLDSAAAIAHVEALRAKGAQFLLFPSTAFWWLDHYKELRQHLESRYRAVVRHEETCLIFALREGSSSGNRPDSSGKDQLNQHLIRQLREIVTNLLPADAKVLVVSKGDEELIKLGGRVAWHFPQTAEGVHAGSYPVDGAEAITQFEALRAKGAEYLVIPATSFWWLEHYVEFRRYLERTSRTVIRQNHICLILDLTEG